MPEYDGSIVIDSHIDTSNFDKDASKMFSKLKEISSKLDDALKLNNPLKEIGNNMKFSKELANAADPLKRLSSELERSRISSEKLRSSFLGMGSVISNTFSGIGSMFTNTFAGIGKMFSTITRRTQWILLGQIIRSVIADAKESIDDLRIYNQDFDKSMQSIRDSFKNVGNSIATSFAPVIQALAPIIANLSMWLTELFNKISMFNAALFTGAKTAVIADTSFSGYAKSTKKAAANTKKGTKAIKDQTNALAKFDKLDVFKQDKKKSPDSSVADAVSSIPQAMKMFKTVEIPNTISSFADKVREKAQKVKHAMQPLIDDIKKNPKPYAAIAGIGIGSKLLSRLIGGPASFLVGTAATYAYANKYIKDKKPDFHNLLKKAGSFSNAGTMAFIKESDKYLKQQKTGHGGAGGKFTSPTEAIKNFGTNMFGNIYKLSGSFSGSKGKFDENKFDFENAKKNIINLSNELKQGFGNAYKWIKENVFDKISNWFKQRGEDVSKFGENLKNGFQNSYNWIKENVFDKISNWFIQRGEDAKKIGEKLKDGFQFSYNWIKANVFDKISNWFIQRGEDAKQFGENLKNGFQNAYNWIKENVFDKISKWFSDFGENFSSFFRGVGNFFSNPISFITSRLSSFRIPHLASGAVVSPNRRFLAMLGDNTSEQEVVSPVSTMKQAFMEAMYETGMNTNNGNVVLQLDGTTFARLINPYTKSEQNRIGISMVEGVAY